MIDLKPLYERAIEHHRAFDSEKWLVPNSIPILYFGDIERYMSSRLKVVTVGLNPSHVEFARNRFSVRGPGSVTAIELKEALSGYFAVNPYSRWFNPAYETLLQPLGASFYRDPYPTRAPTWWTPQRNTALHTDICTPLATAPTWSRLPRDVRRRLQETGYPLWRDLIDALKPTLILISVGEEHLSCIGNFKNWPSFSPFDAAEPRHEMRIGDFGNSKVVWGRAGVRPFFHLTIEQRRLAASAILSQLPLP